MSNPDWTEAPDDATHWDIRGAVWCKRLYFWCYGRWNYMGEIHDLAEDRYIPRPVEPATTAWDGTGFPPVGTVCEVNFCDVWVRATIEHLLTWKGETECIFKTEEDWDFSSCLDCFRPIRTQAQREREEATDFAARAYLSDRVESAPNLSGEQARKISAFFYDAGMLKLPKATA